MFFKKKKLFGNNILSSCDYCKNFKLDENNNHTCSQKSTIDDDNKCSKFSYDPLMRVPVTRSIRLPEYKPEDFKL